jgi:undecaprenyl-diphosphatase
MDTFQLVVLSLIQGLTEFLPISSSGHLILPKEILGWPDQGILFDVAVHLGTLIAVIFYFRKTLLSIATDWCLSIFGSQTTENSRLGWYLIIATIPAVVFGVLLKKLHLDEALRNIWVISGTTIIFGLLLGWSDIVGKHQLPLEKLTLKSTILIGLAQAIALIPGTSRSGITMAAGLLLGLTREACAQFSFLLSIPVILGASIFLVADAHEANIVIDFHVLGLGMLISAISAWICIYCFLGVIKRMGLMPFVIYRLLLGCLLLWFGLQS